MKKKSAFVARARGACLSLNAMRDRA
jgi:hypothetical protein